MNMGKTLQDTELYESRFHYREGKSNVRFFAFFTLLLWSLMCLFMGWRMAFGGVQVSGPSMLNTLYGGDYLLIRYYEEGDELPYGSVIVVEIDHYPEVQQYNQSLLPGQEPTKYIIKRLIAKGGDVVRCKDGVLQVRYAGNEEFTTLYEPYARYDDKKAYDFVEDYVVGEGEIFFLGDNRNISWDSRYKEGKSHLKGLYKESDIYGIVPDWALKHKNVLEKIFFWLEKI